MNDYIQSLSHDNKKVFYKIRNVVLKIVKSTSAVDFNQNCLMPPRARCYALRLSTKRCEFDSPVGIEVFN